MGLQNYNISFRNEFVGGTIEEAIATFLANSLEVINVQSLPVKTQGTVLSNPLFDSTTNLKAYANLVRDSSTEIGCAVNQCPPIQGYVNDLLTIYCVLNGKDIANGDVVYKGTSRNDGGCPSTQCNTRHAYANRMTDNLRNEYVRLHNFRRGKLANGEVNRKDGKFLPKAANMWRIVNFQPLPIFRQFFKEKFQKYACDLEEGAILHASQCPTLPSEPSSRPADVGENFRTFLTTGLSTYEKAAQKSVTEWWKVIRTVNYFENVVIFRPFHSGEPISSFTQMAWATSNEVGCSIVLCKDEPRYVAVCRYRPRGNIVHSNVYEVGNPCSIKPTQPTVATACDPSDGLWY
ncbi:SCP-like protein [Ancylostoma caninum]|uniref:SCP-like protein n=1 Tax=Ancylostoma caninum TaxID=29170 RepID=A0A368GWY3_ANCCA|nr:SCP-like protein [Ancylostoma caninum]